MKSRTTFLILIIFAVLVAACGTKTPTAAPTAQPTAEPTLPAALPTEAPPTATVMMTTEDPPTSSDPVWERVKAAGKLVVGTSADYQPFAYYDANYEITGFDAALARELGVQLGLNVELNDFAFEGLPTALQIGQIDAAAAAISVTPERQAAVDFTNVYYSGQDAILARQNSGIPNIVTPAQLAPYRVAAQRGSIYATWVQNTLIDTGLMPPTNLLLYTKADEAVRDLRENRNDLVIMDQLPADEYILGGDVVMVGQSLNRQLLAIALPKGASKLQAELNAALTVLQNNGTLARLTEEYLAIKPPVVTPAPLPTATALPGPTAAPAGCYDAMSFLRDVSIPDGTLMSPGQNFTKTWRLRNSGTCVWDSNYRLVFVLGDRMNGSTGAVTSRVNPGNVYDISVNLQAPTSPGNYTGVWQMVNPKNVPFGERIWVKIAVPGVAPATLPPPTATQVQPVQPTLAPGPVIDYLSASADSVDQGDLLIVSWSFSGSDIAAARLTRTNPDGSQTPLLGGADVPFQGQYEDLMMTPGTYSYTLTVSSEFGGSAVRTVVVFVNPN